MRQTWMHLLLIGVLAAVVAASGMAAERAQLVEVDGLVRIHGADGSTVRAEAGDTLSRGMALSTGFDATAVLDLGRARVTVDPVSHIELAELQASASQTAQSQSETTMDLSFGRVRSEVRTTESREREFRVQSPVSAAAVKGTDFVYDGSLLTVYEGDVSLRNRIGQTHSVRHGQRSRAYGYESIQSVEAYYREAARLP